MSEAGAKQGKEGRARTESESLTAGERLSFEIARLFPESFRLWGKRVSVKENAGTETTRAKVSADLASMYNAADESRARRKRKA